jgi:predicted transcriptional regulator
MDTHINIYSVVMACLRARRIPQKEVAAHSGVPFSTVAKIAQGDVQAPSVHTVQRLYDYFAQRPELSECFGKEGADV